MTLEAPLYIPSHLIPRRFRQIPSPPRTKNDLEVTLKLKACQEQRENPERGWCSGSRRAWGRLLRFLSLAYWM